MKTSMASGESSGVSQAVLRIAALAAAIRVLSVENQLNVREQSLSVTRPPYSTAEIEFTGRVPFGFAFTEGHDATFHVPLRHHFVIEHICVTCWAQDDSLDVQMVTRSAHMFRHLTLACGFEPGSPCRGSRASTTRPIMVHGSTANTLLFGNGTVHSSSTVPPDTYVQIWGYLEPASDETSC